MATALEAMAGREQPVAVSRKQRARKARLDELVSDVQYAAARLDGEAVLATRAMERVTDVDHYRRQLAGSDPVLNQALAAIELTFCGKAEREVRTFGSGQL